MSEDIKWRGYYDFAAYQAEDPDELMEFYSLKPELTGIPVLLKIDDGGSYIRHDHPIWVYLKNGYNQFEDFLPISVCENPEFLIANPILKIDKDVIGKTFDFIKEYRKELIDIANEKLESIDFEDIIVEHKNKLNHGKEKQEQEIQGFENDRNLGRNNQGFPKSK